MQEASPPSSPKSQPRRYLPRDGRGGDEVGSERLR